jgi:hypothetical protein
MLANRNQRQAAEYRLSWYNVDDRLRACVVHLFRARERHASPPRRHPAANHVKRVGGCVQRVGGTGMHFMHRSRWRLVVCTVYMVRRTFAPCTLNAFFVHN